MFVSSSYRYIHWISCCIVFLYFAIMLTGTGNSMFSDTDPLWHIAAGDWIREHETIPQQDIWSFTAGDFRWLNIAWAWDTLMSYVLENLGWHGVMALNALTIALALALIYAACLSRSHDILASVIAVLGVITMFSLHLRPLQVTNVMVAAWMLVLINVARGHCRSKWLLLLPISMVVWVNTHGGFLVGPLLIGAFFLQALFQRDHALVRQLFATGVAVLIAILCNPYGIYILEAASRPLTGIDSQFILEWQPLISSSAYWLPQLYAALFILLVPWRKLPVLPAERWLAYGWLVLGVISVRHMYIFAILSAPLLACRLHQLRRYFPPIPFAATMQTALLQMYNHRALAVILILAGAGIAAWLPSPMAAKAYHQEQLPVPTLDAEIAFIKKHYPRVRLLNHFNLGSMLIFQTRGAIPVFVDPRTGTAYPPQIMEDYLKFEKALPGWEEIFKRHSVSGLLLPNQNEELLNRFHTHPEWQQVFKGPQATLFTRQ